MKKLIMLCVVAVALVGFAWQAEQGEFQLYSQSVGKDGTVFCHDAECDARQLAKMIETRDEELQQEDDCSGVVKGCRGLSAELEENNEVQLADEEFTCYGIMNCGGGFLENCSCFPFVTPSAESACRPGEIRACQKVRAYKNCQNNRQWSVCHEIIGDVATGQVRDGW